MGFYNSYNSDHIATAVSESILNKTKEQILEEQRKEFAILSERKLNEQIIKTKHYLNSISDLQRRKFMEALMK